MGLLVTQEQHVQIFGLLNTGLRASELCNLNIGDLPIKHGKDCIWFRDSKGKVSRVVDISEKLKKRLEGFVKLYRKGAKVQQFISPAIFTCQGHKNIKGLCGKSQKIIAYAKQPFDYYHQNS